MKPNALLATVMLLALTSTRLDAAPAAPPPANPLPRTPMDATADAGAAKATAPRRVLISGHSLTDQPLPDYLAAIAQSQGLPWDWQRQYVVGSSIKDRSAGRPSNPDQAPWNGYRSGLNRSGENLDMLKELRAAGAGPEPYDTLLITEQHSVLGGLVWNDTVRHLRHFHDRFIEANPRGRTWFYESWFGIDDKADPRRWIDYERAASVVWRCVATRINVSLEAEGRADRIQALPAGRALAHLVERATVAPGVEGLSGTSLDTPEARRATVDKLVRDDVHLTPLGLYYVALVTSAALTQAPQAASWAPPEIDAATAAALQREASAFVEQWRKEAAREDLAACRRFVQRDFIRIYWSYLRDKDWIEKQGRLRASLRWLTQSVQWQWRMARDNAANPFWYDAASDKSYWLPPP
ncbi:MAG TPA: hypothetical protein VFR90_09250 [Methylibium sp.]|uniref:hypothetical protein n=1 Tax=Methylibium sp. TaxID=2067992 RepID=UPI002DB57B96|nr:hypothetical protein [Methylibium sp.]HEU4459294.1 hypothetical protein [Methylibium sp.]